MSVSWEHLNINEEYCYLFIYLFCFKKIKSNQNYFIYKAKNHTHNASMGFIISTVKHEVS